MNLKPLIDRVIKYLQQPSTWAGGSLLASLIGAFLAPEQATAILKFGGSLVALILIFSDSSKSSVESKAAIEALKAELAKKN